MKPKYMVLCTLIVLCLIFPERLQANWAYPFVVWNGYTYVISDEKVEKVGKEIGHVTKYSDMEGTYTGNFSNAYKKGTKYFAIKGISTDEAIAVQDEKGKFVKATREGKYASSKKSSEINFLKWAAVFLVIVILIVTGENIASRKRRR